jgi:hypothetical protein
VIRAPPATRREGPPDRRARLEGEERAEDADRDGHPAKQNKEFEKGTRAALQERSPAGRTTIMAGAPSQDFDRRRRVKNARFLG